MAKSTKAAKSARPRKSRAKTPGARPGGQAGNKNAVKHGFWATRVADAKKVESSLVREIAWLRLFVEQTAGKLDASLANSVLYTAKELSTIYVQLQAIRDIAGLLRVHAFLVGDSSQLEKEIEEGLFLARSDLGILDYLSLPETVAGAADSGSDAQS